MKLSRLYAEGGSFKKIDFNPGFNVIIGRIRNADNKKENTHNLGKSTIVDIVDFMLLKTISTEHIFKKHPELFKNYIFYLEVILNNNTYLTIRRAVSNNTKISLRTNKSTQELTKLTDEIKWNHEALPLKTAKEKLQSYLEFDVIPEYDYRKSLTYFLRKQQDYSDVFQLQKFIAGKHIDWKPFLFSLLGFDGGILSTKMETDEEVDILARELKSLKPKDEGDSIDRINGQIEILERKKNELASQIDNFKFYQADNKNTLELSNEIEQKISKLNIEAYNLRFEIKKMGQSISNSNLSEFDIEEIEEIFNEVSVLFPNNLKKSYTELIDFNKIIQIERKKIISSQLEKNITQLNDIEIVLQELDTRRSELFNTIKEQETFKKFKNYQMEISDIESELTLLSIHKATLKSALEKELSLNELKLKSAKLKLELSNLIDEGNSNYTNIKSYFNIIIKEILNEEASISMQLNNNGNTEFKANYLNENITETNSKDKGYSYRRLLCVAFDLALVLTYINKSFYRFAFHDGVLEALDNRTRNAVIDYVRKLPEKYGIQYIITLIEDDSPDNPENYFNPSDDEIVLELNDNGNEGRLFGFIY